MWFAFFVFTFTQKASADFAVAKFQEEGIPIAESYLAYKGEIPTMNAFSLCFRLKIYKARSPSSILSYAIEDFKSELFISINVQQNTIDISCCYHRFLGTIEVKVGLFEWLSFCFSINLLKKECILVQNGKSQAIKNRAKLLNKEEKIILQGNGKLYFGQDQDANRNKFNPHRSFCGDIADFYLFKEELEEREMIDFTLCMDKIKRESVANFENFQEDFEAHNISHIYMENIDFCQPLKTFFKFFTERKTFALARSFCHSVGGKLYIPANDIENEQLFNMTSSTNMCEQETAYYYDCIWLGAIADINNSNNWLSYLTKEPLNFTSFASTENKDPNDFSCTTFYACESSSPIFHGKWIMRKCSDLRKHVCKFDAAPILRLRGLCKNSLFDRLYTYSPDTNDNVFHGYFFSKIFTAESLKSNTDGKWKIKRIDMPGLEANFIRLSATHYPIGRNIWTFKNDVCKVDTAELKLSTCKHGEFTCNDGSCIKLSKRCDLWYNCLDGSDEEDCYPLILPPKYFADIPPPALEGRKANKVAFYSSILNILDFDIKTFDITLELHIKIIWRDSRLKYKNLSFKRKGNHIEDLEKFIWKPDFTFQGPTNTSCNVIDRKSSFFILKQSDPNKDNDENVNEDLIYEGAHNPIVWEMKKTIAINCQFNLVRYPFDIQTCDLMIGVKETMTNSIELHLLHQNIEYYGPKTLLEYEVVNSSIYLAKETNIVTITMEYRNLVSYFIASTFAPTFLMVIVGYLTFYFPLNQFNERIMVSLTALLVQSSFFSEVTDSIPKTVYLKKIDIWCIFCILILFFITTSLTIINCFLDSDKDEMSFLSAFVSPFEEKSQKMSTKVTRKYVKTRNRKCVPFSGRNLNLICRIIFPCCSLIFVIWYSASNNVW